MSSWSLKAGFAGFAVVIGTAYALAQMPNYSGMHEQMAPAGPDSHHAAMPDAAAHNEMQGQTTMLPTMPGQEAFGTIQEIVQILEADPTTDWSKVNISALREHLIDMNELALHAAASERALDNGIEIAVTGQGRTLDAIRRMVPAHVHELNRLGWNARTEDLPNGVKLIVTSGDPRQVTKLKALGFMGIMVQGAHHQRHHLMMAKGEFMH
jgi:hypothetical protein